MGNRFILAFMNTLVIRQVVPITFDLRLRDVEAFHVGGFKYTYIGIIGTIIILASLFIDDC